MIDRKRLLTDLQKLVKVVESDLREEVAAKSDVRMKLEAEWKSARDHVPPRTAEAFETWRDERLTQVAVAWVLSCVFVRFLEDNKLLDAPYLSGPGDRLNLARGRKAVFVRAHPDLHDREYLLHVFREVGTLPAMAGLLGDKHNPLWSVALGPDGAKTLFEFWQKPDPATGALLHDFTDSDWSTRFLGDIYQDLSEAAQKRYALLQTPDFVLDFILDRTLEPAIQEFGYQEVTLIDPTCGSGHFLIAAFQRLLARRMTHEPGVNLRATVQSVLDQISGVDLNPYAIAISRFRLLLAALRACGEKRLRGEGAFGMNLAVGDSLLHGGRPKQTGGRQYVAFAEEDKLAHVYDTEDADELRRILGHPHHVVVGNPPYITPKDPALREEYRRRYPTCGGKYSLGVPFTERFFDLALTPAEGASPAGYIGMITTNSFMKREFGKKLIERFLSQRDLSHVVDTSVASIPGHGTPTVILFARNRPPISRVVRAVRGIKGEASTPSDPARGPAWTAIVEQVDQPGSVSAYVSSDDVGRSGFSTHPWSIGGGGSAELKDRLDELAACRLQQQIASVGPGCILCEDDAFLVGRERVHGRSVVPKLVRVAVVGDQVRDWMVASDTSVLYPYDEDVQLCAEDHVRQIFWPLRTVLWARPDFSQRTYRECGRTYWEYHQIPTERNRTPLAITFSEVATHNHFAFDRGGKVFTRTAPIIKLSAGATEDDHLGLLGLLNSSTACFWMQQVCHNKGGPGGGSSKDEKWHDFYALNGTRLLGLPVPSAVPLELGRRIDALATEASSCTPAALARVGPPSRDRLDAGRARWSAVRGEMIALQEELDWTVLAAFGVTDRSLVAQQDPPKLSVGERAFEIVLANDVAAGTATTKWFEWLQANPRPDLPTHWPSWYREVVAARIRRIEADRDVALIESMPCKRRWETDSWETQESRALKAWLLDRLEHPRYWPIVEPASCARLADLARHDAEFLQVAELYRGRPDFDVAALVTELVEDEAVPYLAAFRYSESGREKRRVWERTWDLQRAEDAGQSVGQIPVPPKYGKNDFARGTYWTLRGKLDVPKERFISYPMAEREGDPSPVVGWAGWDHLQQAEALAGYVSARREKDGWGADRVPPLLSGLVELLPWLKQWHNEFDPHEGMGAGDAFARFVESQARELGLTVEVLKSWTPPEGAGRKKGGRRRKQTP